MLHVLHLLTQMSEGKKEGRYILQNLNGGIVSCAEDGLICRDDTSYSANKFNICPLCKLEGPRPIFHAYSGKLLCIVDGLAQLFDGQYSATFELNGIRSLYPKVDGQEVILGSLGERVIIYDTDGTEMLEDHTVFLLRAYCI